MDSAATGAVAPFAARAREGPCHSKTVQARFLRLPPRDREDHIFQEAQHRLMRHLLHLQ